MSASRPSVQMIAQRLREALQAAQVEVLDDSAAHAGHTGAREGGHFRVCVTSPRFTGLSRLARHRLVYDCLLPWFAQGIHALTIVARAPEESEVR